MEPLDDEPVAGPASPAEAAPERPIDYVGHGHTLMTKCITDAKNNAARLLRDRQDMENLRFDRGGAENQWCVWDEGTSRFTPRGTDPDQGGLPAWFPRPVSNVFHKTMQDLTSILDQSEPAQVFAPKTDDDQDQAAADVAEDAVPVLREECGYDSEGHRHELNQLAVLTNGAAYVPYYDTDERYGMDEIPLFRCKVCGEETLPLEVEDNDGKCPNPECGNSDPEAFEAVQDPENLGALKTVPAPIGRLCAEVLTSFEYSLPSSARRAHAKSVPWFLSHRRMAPEDIVRMWGEKARSIAHDKGTWADGPLTKSYADEMRRMSSPAIGNQALGGSNPATDGPVVYRLQHDPIVTDTIYLPEGFYGVMIGGQLIDFGPLPFEDTDGTPFKNVLFRQFESSPATSYGHPPADDQVPLAKSRNLSQALIELILMNDAAPTHYLPDSVTFIDEPTSVPGEWVRYRSLDGSKPTESRGFNPPEGLFAYLDQQDTMADKLSGLNAILRGERPKGDPTLGEAQMLMERGMATFRAPLDMLIQFERDLSFMLLAIGRATLWSPRLRRLRGEEGQWEIKQFAAADLKGQIDIVVDRASAWPKSPLMQQLRLKEALQMGVLPPPFQDPELSAKLLVEMNLSHLKKSLDKDRKQIARRLERWKAATSPMEIQQDPPDPLVENLPLQFYLLQQFLKGEVAERIKGDNPPVYEAMRMHLQQLQTMMMPPAPVDPNAAKDAAPGSKGELQRAIDDGTLVPGDGGAGKGGALEAALADGTLVPGDGSQQPLMPEQQQPMGPTGPSGDELSEAAMSHPVMPQPKGGYDL